MRTFLPSIYGNTITGQASEEVELFINLWLAHLGERAKRMVQDDRLMACALEHATYLDGRTGDELTQSLHVGKGGTTPNERVRASGYELPNFYPTRGNQVESCAITHEGAAKALQLWLESPAHHAHVSVTGWYSEHVHWGVANVGHDWVFVSAPKEQE